MRIQRLSTPALPPTATVDEESPVPDDALPPGSQLPSLEEQLEEAHDAAHVYDDVNKLLHERPVEGIVFSACSQHSGDGRRRVPVHF